MTAALLQPPHLSIEERLHVNREDIVFYNISPERVRIEVTVWNLGDQRSRPTRAEIMTAPLGAFVRWRPLASVWVPAIKPGQPRVIGLEADSAAPRLLGRPDRVSPQQLLTALDRDDDRTSRLSQGLPADLLGLLGQGSVYWAGNLNVFVGNRAVERHMAQALRVYPGRVNMAFFIVGSGRDAYAFHLAGEAAKWEAALYDPTGSTSLAPDFSRCAPLSPDEWIEVQRQHYMMLALQPPSGCKRGTVEVHVTQRSTGATAVVEFGLDPKAAGPGCYVV